MAEKEAIIKLTIDTGKTLDKIVDLTKELDALKEREKEVKKAIKDAGKATDDQIRALEENRNAQRGLIDQLRVYRKAMDDNRKIVEANQGSLNQLRAEVRSLTAAYDALSEADRNSAAGMEMRDKINELTDALKGGEEETQRFQRNVGNYENAIKSALASSNPFIGFLMQLTAGTTTATGAMGALSGGVKAVKVALDNLMRNPIGAVLTVIAAVIMAVRQAIKSSELATMEWNRAIAPAKVLLDMLLRITQELTHVLFSLVEAVHTVTNEFTRFVSDIPVLGTLLAPFGDILVELNDRYKKMTEDQLKLAQRKRDTLVKNAEDEREIERLKNEAKDKENKTEEERLAALQKAMDLEVQRAERNKADAEEALRLAELEAKATENSAEVEDKLAQARAAVAQADTELYRRQREMLEQMNGLRNEMASDEKAALDEKKAKYEAYLKVVAEVAQKEKDAIEAVIDLQIELMAEGFEKQRRMAEEANRRQIEALRKRLEEEENLSKTARESINQQIVLLEQKLAQEIEAITAESLKQQVEERAAQIEEELKQRERTNQLKLDLVEKGSEEEFALRQERAEIEREQALNDDTLTAEQRELIEQKYLDTIFGLEDEYAQADFERQNELNEQEIAKEKEKQEAMNTIKTKGQDILDMLAEHSRAAAIASKVVALGEIAVQTGVALAKGIASSAGVAFPGNIAAIATTIATVMANIMTAIKTVKSAKFATGGYVSGEGTSTSDSIPAQLSNSESVMAATPTSMFWPITSAMNVAGGGSPIIPNGASTASMRAGEDMLARSFARGAQSIQLSVAVSEINEVQQRVAYLETLGDVG